MTQRNRTWPSIAIAATFCSAWAATSIAQGAEPQRLRSHLGLIIGRRIPQRAQQALEAQLKGRQNIESLGTIAVSSAQETTARPPRRRIRRLLKRAASRFTEFQLDAAYGDLTAATKLLEPHIGLTPAVQLDRERLHLAIALAHTQRDENQLEELLLEYSARYGHEAPPTTLWPPDLRSRAASLASRPAMHMRIELSPKDAELFLNGSKVPLKPDGTLSAAPGRHRIEARLDGYHSKDLWVEATTVPTTTALVLQPAVARDLTRVDPNAPLPTSLYRGLGQVAEAAGADYLIVVQRSRSKLKLRLFQRNPKGVVAEIMTDDSSSGINLGVGQILEHLAPAGHGPVVPTWAWIGAGTAAATIGLGTVLRMMAVGTQDEYLRLNSGLTQARERELRSTAEAQAQGGTVLIGVGVAAVAGIASWIAIDQL